MQLACLLHRLIHSLSIRVVGVQEYHDIWRIAEDF
jgi:hypothetical protein